MKELEEISKLQVQNRINIYCFNMGVNQANVTHVGPLLWRGERAGLTEGALRELGVAGSPVRVPHARIFTDSARVCVAQPLVTLGFRTVVLKNTKYTSPNITTCHFTL